MNRVTRYGISFAISTRQSWQQRQARIHASLLRFLLPYTSTTQVVEGRKNMIVAELVSVLVYFYIAKLEEFSQHFLCSPIRANGGGTALRRTFLYTQQLVFIMDSVIKHRRRDQCAVKSTHRRGEWKSEKSFSFSFQTVLLVTLKRFSGSCGGIIAARINTSRSRCEIENR